MFEDKTVELEGESPERGTWTLTVSGPLCKVQDFALNVTVLANSLTGNLNKKPCKCKDGQRKDSQL